MAATDIARRLIELVELDTDRCKNRYGVAPCTASAAAGGECYNTFRTCQDTTHYNIRALSFDGVNDYASVAYNAAFDFERTDSFSLVLRLKVPAAGNSGLPQLLGKKAAGTGRGYLLYFDASTGNLGFKLSNTDNTNALSVASNGSIADGQWHTVGATYAGTSLPSDCALYVDGAAVAQTTGFNTLSATTVSADALYAAANNGTGNFLVGAIAEAWIYKRQLTAQEMINLHQGGIAVSTTNLVGHWSFFEGSGTSLSDSSANALTGAISGAAWQKGPPHTYRFCGRGTPAPLGAIVRPYMMAMSEAPTEIDPEKGLGVRTNITVTLSDAADSDLEQDPYAATRASGARSTFLRRFLARNIALNGRAARIKRLYVAPGGAYTLNDSGWKTENFIIDGVKGPDRNGNVQFTLKDPLKLTDRVKLPALTDGELLSGITSTATSLTLKTGKGAQYGSSGYICVSGKEVIQFTSAAGDVLSWPDTTYRARFGTAAQAHNADARVQLCKAWSGATIAAWFEDALNAAGIADANIDLAGLASENSIWFGTYAITACLTEPETVSDLMKEMCMITQGVIWWAAKDQQVKFKALRPLSPLSPSPSVLTDKANFVDQTVEVTRNDAQRLTAVAVFYAPLSAVEKKDNRDNYQRGYVFADVDAASAAEYDETRVRTIYARLLDIASGQAAAEMATRMVLFRRDPPIEIRARLDPKDGTTEIGDQIDLQTFGIVDFNGDISTQRVIVTRKQDNGEDLDMTFLVTFLNRRYFWIAPDGQPDYATATGDQRRYGYISDATGKLSDGSDGHVIA